MTDETAGTGTQVEEEPGEPAEPAEPAEPPLKRRAMHFEAAPTTKQFAATTATAATAATAVRVM